MPIKHRITADGKIEAVEFEVSKARAAEQAAARMKRLAALQDEAARAEALRSTSAALEGLGERASLADVIAKLDEIIAFLRARFPDDAP